MIAAPWYLLSFGIVLIIIGAILGGVFGAGASSGPGIDPRMTDQEIARRLRRQSSMTFPGVVVYVGSICILVSVAWRLLRIFF